jgi:hypothetical protein
MKKSFLVSLIILVLTACDAFNVQPQPFPVWSPIPSRTPVIVSPTPIILTLPITFTSSLTMSPPITSTSSETWSPTSSPSYTPTLITPTSTFTPTPLQSVNVEILGCNTGIDITHGMGEVTNAYVTVKNTGLVDIPNTCALLRANDEDRIHPNKKVCIPNLPVNNQMTFKLTVDSAYKQDTAIQVDISSNDILLLRVDKQSCTDINLFGGEPADIGVIKPIAP